MTRLFLGGTVGNTTWRRDLIEELTKRGVNSQEIFNPQLPAGTWNEAAKERETLAKKEAQYTLFYITDPQEPGNSISTYSLVEAVFSSYENPNGTIIILDNTANYPTHIAKVIKAIVSDFATYLPNIPIFTNTQEGINYLVERMTNTSTKTSGGNI